MFQTNFLSNIINIYTHWINLSMNEKKMDKWISIYCTVGVNWVTVLHNSNFKFDDNISFYKIKDSDRW